jgi:protein SCO1/2
MKRRSFLALGLAPLLWPAPAPAARTGAGPMSLNARRGFFPNVPLLTHEGRRVRFYEDLIRGKTVLFNFFVLGCTEGRCPTATANLRRVQELLGERMGRDIFFYSITLRPESDTPSRLKDYAEAFEIGPGWLFLTGKPGDIDRLRRSQGYVDPDPVRDRDPANHSGMARYGSDRLERWAAISLRTSPKAIATSILGL